MKKRELVEIIAKVTKIEVRKVIKEEVKKQLAEHFKSNKPVQNVEPQQSQQPGSLQEALNMTAQEQEEWPTAGNFTSADAMRSKFTAMQQGPQNPIPVQDVNGRPLDPNKVTPDVMKALTRDYSDLMKHPKMQGK